MNHTTVSAVSYDEVSKMQNRVTLDAKCVPADLLRLITSWRLQNTALRQLFELFQTDEYGLRTQSDSIRCANLDALKESVGLAGYPHGEPA